MKKVTAYAVWACNRKLTGNEGKELWLTDLLVGGWLSKWLAVCCMYLEQYKPKLGRTMLFECQPVPTLNFMWTVTDL